MAIYGTVKINDVATSDHRLSVTEPKDQSPTLATVESAAAAAATGSSRVFVVVKRVFFGAVFWSPVSVAVNGSVVALGAD